MKAKERFMRETDNEMRKEIQIAVLEAKEEMLRQLLEARQLIDSDRTKLSQEIRQLVDEAKCHKADIEREIATCKGEVSERAIDKTMVIVKYIAGGALIIGTVVTGMSWLGIKDIKDQYKEIYRGELNKWLAFEGGNSPAKKELDDVRARAMLDSYIIKLARQKSDPFNSLHRLELKNLELERLLTLMAEPNTSYADFNDAARVIRASRGYLMPFYPDDHVAKGLIGLLSNEQVSDDKKVSLLTYMGNEQVFLLYAKSVLEKENAHFSVKAGVFPIVARWDSGYAIRYAKSHLNDSGIQYFSSKLAEFLAVHSPICPELKTYIDKTFANSKEGAISLIDTALGILKSDDAKKEGWNESKALFVNLLARIIDEGAVFDVMSFSSSAKHIALSQRNKSVPVRHSKELFESAQLLNKLLEKYESNKNSLYRLVSAVQIMDHGYIVNSLMIQPQAEARFYFEDGTQLLGKEVSGMAWLKVARQLDRDNLALSWRGTDGLVRQRVISKVENLKGSHYKFSFDEEILRNLARQEFDMNDI